MQVGTTVYEAYPLNVVRSMLDVMDKCVRYRGPSKYSVSLPSPPLSVLSPLPLSPE